MGKLLLPALLMALLTLGATCQQTPPEAEGGLRLIISDMPCPMVWERVLQELKRLNVPVIRSDREKGLIETAPVLQEPLPGDPFKRVEEQYQLELSCRGELTTRLSGKAVVTGWKADDTRGPVQNADRYWGRFLDSLRIK